MSLEAGLAYAHLLAILSLVVFLSSEAALCRAEWMNEAVVRRLGRLDLIYGLSALAVLLTGLARIDLGMKGSAWYWGNPWLHARKIPRCSQSNRNCSRRWPTRWNNSPPALAPRLPSSRPRWPPTATSPAPPRCNWPSRSGSTRASWPKLCAALLALPAYQRWVSDIDIAGPGFINIRLQPAAKQQIVSAVLQAGARFGFQAPRNERVLVEFVSANPTGPLHVGHGRQAALGDAICNLYATQGWHVHREFYYNDAGVQIATLANSTQLRAKGFKPGDDCWPTDPWPEQGVLQRRLHPGHCQRLPGQARPSRPTTASSRPAAMWTTWTASASSPWPTCATSRIWT
jgi:hypothetical protein